LAEISAAVRADDAGVRWWEPIVALVGGNAIALATAVVGEIVVLIGFAMRRSNIDVAAIAQTFPVLMGTLALNNLATFSLSWWLAWRRVRPALAAYFPAVGASALTMAALSGVAISFAINGGNTLLDRLGVVHFESTTFEIAMMPHGILQFVVCAVVVGLIAPAAEEFVFRGLLLRWLKSAMGVAGAILISALVFGLIHAEFFFHWGAQGALFTLELVLAGAVLAIWVQRTGSLRASFACHAAYNLTATLLGLFFP